jgi:hypothetical protein
LHDITETSDVEKPVPTWLELIAVVMLLACVSLMMHGRSLLFPDRYAFSPADILGRQPELGGNASFDPQNRLLIDPVLQFQVWDVHIKQAQTRSFHLFWNPFSSGGAPLAGNGQSRIFDPIHRFFLLFPLPWAWAAESFARFIWTGLGFHLLCKILGLPRMPRIWCPVALSLTGFFTLWRQYPLVATGSICPWFFWAFLRLWQNQTTGRWTFAVLLTSLLIVSGNIQVAAVGMMIVLAMFCWFEPASNPSQKINLKQRIFMTSAALFTGLLIAAPGWISLADYLAESPIWADRIAEHSGSGRGTVARWRDLPCLVAPYLYGSERHGDANIHKAIGAGNVNEAASGYFGMVCLIALVPCAFFTRATNHNQQRLIYGSAGLFTASLLIGYRLPPVNWVWPHLPLLQGIDPRRFLIGMPMAGILLAGLGLQRVRLGACSHSCEAYLRRLWLCMAVSFAVASILPLTIQDKIRTKAETHYHASIAQGPEHAKIVGQRVTDQMQAMTRVWPAYMLGRCILLLTLWCIWKTTRRQPNLRSVLTCLLATLELAHFGWNYNPHVESKWLRFGELTPVINALRQFTDEALESGHECRILALGELLPPNELMRFGLKDLRNYDSIETLQSMIALEGLFDQHSEGDRTSRRDVSWQGVERARLQLENYGVIAVIGSSPPPADLFTEVFQLEPSVWVGRWPGKPRLEITGSEIVLDEPGLIEIRINRQEAPAQRKPAVLEPVQAESQRWETCLIRETWSDGWQVEKSDFNDTQILADPVSGFILLKFQKERKTGNIRIFYQPKHWDHALICFYSGLFILVCQALIQGLKSRKNRSSLFSVMQSQG